MLVRVVLEYAMNPAPVVLHEDLFVAKGTLEPFNGCGIAHDESGDEKSRDIMKIVNAHHQSLAYLSAQASKIEAEVVKLERANEAERRAQAAV